MARNGTPNLDSLSLSDTEMDDTEDLFASPSVVSQKTKAVPQPANLSNKTIAPPLETEEEALMAHEASLNRELSALRTMNQVISGVIEALEKAKSNMEIVSATVSTASTLLKSWSQILNLTEFNQRLILNQQWQGASQDIADGENELMLKQQERERREAEENRRAEVREREREEAETRRMTEESAAKGPRGRGKGTVRGTGRSGVRGYVGVGGQGGVRGTTSKATPTTGRSSGIGRGPGRSRGKQ